MKRKHINFMLFILAMFLLMGNVSYAVSDRILNISMNGENLKVREVPVLMNGKTIKSQSPSFLYVDRTLVSARLIAENYGAKVDWDQATQTVTILHEGNLVKLTINKATAIINGKTVKMDANSSPRLVNFGGGSAVTMVPLSFMADILGYETDWDYTEKAAYLKKKVVKEDLVEEKEEIKEEPREEVKEEPRNLNKVYGVKKSTKNGEDILLVEGGGQVKRKVMRLSNPERFVIDLMDSQLEGSDFYSYKHDVGTVEGVRISQFVPDSNYRPDDKIVRIVLDMKDYVSQAKVEVREDSQDLILVPEKAKLDKLGYKDGLISIRTDRPSAYKVDYIRNRNLMEISIPSENLDLTEGRINIPDNLLAQYEVVKSGDKTLIRAHFRRGISYDILSGPLTDKLEIKVARDGNVKKSDRIIVLDPGHGGKDPGTTGINKAKEKEVVLDVSLAVRDKLENRGYSNVIMTRTTDQYPSLEDRAKLANSNHADIFVSIHANSNGSSAPKGIETFVPRTPSSIWKKEQGNQLARLIQDELIKGTGASNRGVKEANHHVTRNTDMAGVLVEIGFLSNPSEASLLVSPGYQDDLAEAITRGIERYFEIY